MREEDDKEHRVGEGEEGILDAHTRLPTSQEPLAAHEAHELEEPRRTHDAQHHEFGEALAVRKVVDEVED